MILCSRKNVSVSLTWSIPPESVIKRASNDNSLLLSLNTGSSIVPDPLPPSIVTEITFLMSKSWGSTWMSVTSPDITGCIKAFVVPAPALDNWIIGGFITS